LNLSSDRLFTTLSSLELVYIMAILSELLLVLLPSNYSRLFVTSLFIYCPMLLSSLHPLTIFSDRFFD
jgi:hypothetical protein